MSLELFILLPFYPFEDCRFCSHIPHFTSDISNLCSLFFISLPGVLKILLIFFKKPLCFIDFLYYLSVFSVTDFCIYLYFLPYFLPLAFFLFSFSFSKFLRAKIRLWIWYCSSFLMYAFSAIKFSLSIAVTCVLQILVCYNFISIHFNVFVYFLCDFLFDA